MASLRAKAAESRSARRHRLSWVSPEGSIVLHSRRVGGTGAEIEAAALLPHNVGVSWSCHSKLSSASVHRHARPSGAGADSIEHGYWIDDDTLEMRRANGVTGIPTWDTWLGR